MGYISSGRIDDEYEEYYLDNTLYNNNKGIDWYLGGVCLRYGEVILECPAYKKYFQVAFDNGNGMSKDPTVKFMKSSGYKNCIPIESGDFIIIIFNASVFFYVNSINSTVI